MKPRIPVSSTGVLLLLALLLTPSLPAVAQGSAESEETPAADSGEPGESFVEEILVTARRRAESLQNTPISITAFSESALTERSMSDLSDLGDFAPNIDFAHTGGFGDQASEAAITIRGIGQLDTALFADPAVGLYVDGVFLARAQGGVLDLLDLERVEILRGPQGTLFGKNTTGGAIQLITRKPGNAFAGRLSGTIGELDRRDARASVAGPLSDQLSASLALMSTQRDGFSRSLVTGQEFNDDNREAARLSLNYRPSSNVTIDWNTDVTREREAGSNQILLSLVTTPLLDFYNRSQIAGGRQPVTEALLTGSLFESRAGFPSHYDGDTYGSSLTVNWTAGRSLGVQSITAWRGFEFDTAGDGDALPNIVAQRLVQQRHDQFSQELQVSGLTADDRLTWVVGGLYFREHPREQSDASVMTDIFPALEAAPGPIVSPPGVPAFLCDPGPPPPGVPCFGGAGNPLNLGFINGFSGNQFIDLETISWALFAEGTYNINDRLSATLGARFSRDEKTFDYTNVNAFGIVDSDLFNEGDWDALTPRFSLAYQAKPDVLLYFSASRGYKSGGFNGRPQQRQVLDPFDPETVMAYEIGIKSDLLNRRLRLNGSAFFSDYEDIQFGASLDVGGQPVFVTQNAGSGEITGFELELTAFPAVGLEVTAAAGYTDTELVELDPRVPAGLQEGGTLPKTPEWTFNAAVQYSFRLGDNNGAIIARGDYSYRSDFFNDISNSPGIAQDAYDLVNARLLYTPPSGRWDVALFGTNLTDEEYLENGFNAQAFGFNIGLAGRPREWGLTAEFRF